MLESMTGFASLEYRQDDVGMALTLRSTNSRFLDLRIGLPKGFHRFEAVLEKLLRNSIIRGRLDLEIQLLPESRQVLSWKPNVERATAVRDGLEQVRKTLGLSDPVEFKDILLVAGHELFEQSHDSSSDIDWETHLSQATTTAISNLRDSRQQEGQALSDVLGAEIKELDITVSLVEDETASLAGKLRKRLTDKVFEILHEAPNPISPERMEQEIILQVERADIHEEIVRLKTHLMAFEKARLESKGPCGKRLDFLLQEILREVNTVGSKVPDAGIRNQVVSMKTLIEQLRQQVANIA